MADSDAATRAAAFDLIEKMVREEFVPPHNNNRRIETLSAELSRLTTLRPLSELHDDDGAVLAWRLSDDLRVCEPPYVASILDDDPPWEDDDESRWFWSPLPKVRKPDGAR